MNAGFGSLLPNAVGESKGLPISVWAKPLPAGENDLDLGKGAYVVLGFVPEEVRVTPRAMSEGQQEEQEQEQQQIPFGNDNKKSKSCSDMEVKGAAPGGTMDLGSWTS